jgi:hypothetical protein
MGFVKANFAYFYIKASALTKPLNFPQGRHLGEVYHLTGFLVHRCSWDRDSR